MWVRGLKHDEIIVEANETQSHPVWVRGLKHEHAEVGEHRYASHPVWVRGLKPPPRHTDTRSPTSHPVWVRGLKLSSVDRQKEILESHPVWVRGLKPCRLTIQDALHVAPRVGAWIETTKVCIFRVRLGSRTLCARIETSMITMQGTTQNVEPCVVRGLKQKIDATCSRCTWPHPVWVRGLKPAECGK